MSTDFHLGQAVRVRAGHPPGHVRTPHYCRGQPGRIVECLGPYPNPEHLAYRHTGHAPVVLYRVRFRNADLWPEGCRHADETDIEIFEHWLLPVQPVSLP